MTSNNCIVVQGHIPSYDVQGSLTASEKLIMAGLSLRHLRKQNPDAYIILTGHGDYPVFPDGIVNECYWEPQCRPLDGNGYVAGMPAQYWFISEGVERAMKAGFNRLIKTRLDCVIGIPNIADHCEAILQKEGKKLLLTQQTGWNMRCGDCFLYGNADIIDDIFWKNNSVFNQDGLLNTGHWAFNALIREHPCCGDDAEWLPDRDKDGWRSLLTSFCSFRDTINLQFADLRWNWNSLREQHGDGIEDYILNRFDYRRYAWGNQWHRFDDRGNMIYRYLDDLISEKEFYGK
jgi:hypothetical protein